MKYYSSHANETVIIGNNVAQSIKSLTWRVGRIIELRSDYWSYLESYLMDGTPECGRVLCHMLTPAEFRMCIGLRKFLKLVQSDIRYRSPRIWTNKGSYVMLHLNVGAACVIVDNHAD